MDPLSPTIDLVFKLLLQRSPVLLLDMLNAVLEPPAPITEAEVLNPDLEVSYPDDHGVVLDVAVRLADGSRLSFRTARPTRPSSSATSPVAASPPCWPSMCWSWPASAPGRPSSLPVAAVGQVPAE